MPKRQQEKYEGRLIALREHTQNTMQANKKAIHLMVNRLLFVRSNAKMRENPSRSGTERPW